MISGISFSEKTYGGICSKIVLFIILNITMLIFEIRYLSQIIRNTLNLHLTATLQYRIFKFLHRYTLDDLFLLYYQYPQPVTLHFCLLASTFISAALLLTASVISAPPRILASSSIIPSSSSSLMSVLVLPSYIPFSITK